MNLLVISEEAAKKGIKEFIDYFMRDTESRKVFTTTIVKNGKAIDAIKILQPLETVTSTNIQSSFEAVKKTYGTIRNDSFDQIVMCLYTPGRNPTISAIEIIGSPGNGEKNDNLSTTKPDTSIKISNLGILKNDKLIGYISVEEAFYYAMIRGTLSNLSLSFPCDDNDYGNVIVDSMKSNLEMTVKKNKPVASINVTGKAALTEFNCKLDLTKEENIDEIEKMAEKEIKKKLKKVIEEVQNYNSDIFGFGEKLYRNNYKYWIKNKKNWDKIFPKIEASTKVDISVERMSSTINTAKSR
jgi:spore germination protein KC